MKIFWSLCSIRVGVLPVKAQVCTIPDIPRVVQVLKTDYPALRDLSQAEVGIEFTAWLNYTDASISQKAVYSFAPNTFQVFTVTLSGVSKVRHSSDAP